MNEFLCFATAAVFLEAVITYINMIFVNRRVQWQTVTAMGIGIAFALVYRINLLAMAGLLPATVAADYLGCIFSGLILARGSNYVFDLLGKLSAGKAE